MNKRMFSVLAAVSLCLLFAFSFGGRKAPARGSAMSVPSAVPGSRGAVRDRETLLAALRLVGSGDTEAEELMGFYREMAVHGRIESGHLVLEEGRSLAAIRKEIEVGMPRFLVLPSTTADRIQLGEATPANFIYSMQCLTLFVPPLSQVSAVFLGARSMHEVRHAFDHLKGGERIGDVEQFNLGEVHAHTLEHRMLDRATQGGYSAAVKRFVIRFPTPLGFPKAYFYPKKETAMADLEPFLRSLPAAQSLDETRSRMGSFIAAINFQYADDLGLGERGKAELYANMHE